LLFVCVCALPAAADVHAPVRRSDEVSRVVETARAMRKAWDLREHGASLRELIGAETHVEGEWEIYYDDDSGHPYYYDAVSGRTQWENPFAVRHVEGGGLFESWQLYDSFGFVGVSRAWSRMIERIPRSHANFAHMWWLCACERVCLYVHVYV
jgi:WW domain